MKTIIGYLDELKEKYGSDYRTAQLLEVEKQTISNIRKRGLMSDETALKVGGLLEIDPSEVLIAAAMARSTGEVKTAWENVGKKAGIAASLMLVTMLSASQIEEITGISTIDNIHYAKSRIPR